MLTTTQQMQFDYWRGFAEFVFRKGRVVRATYSPYHQSFLGVERIDVDGKAVSLPRSPKRQTSSFM